MIEPELVYLEEPNLTFAYGQKAIDPRDGLTLFGPFFKDKIQGQINIGIIGPQKQREYLIEYLKKIHKPIFSKKNDIARPFFPGLESIFGIHINFNNINEVEVPEAEIIGYLHYEDGHQRVHNLTNLYFDRLSKYHKEEDSPVSLWFVVIPDEIYKFGRKKSKIPKSNFNVKVGLKKKDRNNITQDFLFNDMNEERGILQEAYQFEVNFHNQLKAKLLSDKIVTQIIRESTIAYSKIWTDEKRIESERIFDTAKAWNISTTLYYKVGGLPWCLGEVREDVCYLGLVYKKLDNNENNKNACCAAQMFLDSGDGMVFRGNIGPWYNPKTKEYHISRQDAFNLISQSLETFKTKLGSGRYPKQIFIHAKTYFDDEEWEGFSEAVSGKSQVIGVRIQPTSAFKLYRQYKFCVPRGMTMVTSKKKAFLWTKGFIPRLQTQLGLETPNPISIEVTRGNEDILQVCKDVLALTKLNYNACIFADGEPVTLRFADSIGEVLTAGKNVVSDVLPFKHYL